MHAIISIHDVMPQSLGNVHDLLKKMEHLAPSAITLLVVPGLDWKDEQIGRLKSLQATGYRLAGHGWHHRTRRIRTLYHHFHAGLISRTAAEHLSLETGEITRLMQDCFQWFAEHGLESPDLYVPPAWAMGDIPRQRLGDMPFRYFETTAGLYDSASGRQMRLPLLGFEADTALRAASLTCWNAVNGRLGSPRRPVRLSIHPFDHQLRLAGALDRFLGRVEKAVPYASVF